MATKIAATIKVSIIRGIGKNTGDNLEIAYAGTDYINARYWASMFFEYPSYGSPEFLPEKGLTRLLKKKHPQCPLLLHEFGSTASTPEHDETTFIVPRFINAQMDISLPLSEILKNSRSGFGRIARWVKSKQLDYECTIDEEAQKEFYDEMYLPFMTKRHQDRSLIVDFNDIFSSKVKSEIIMVKKNGERVAGAVMRYWENRPTLGFFGIKEGKSETILKWNTAAMYFFAMISAKNKGIKRLHLGGSAAFILNGINSQKSRLGGRIDTDVPWQDSGMVKFVMLKKLDVLTGFFAANPFAFVGNDGKLRAAIWLSPNKKAGFSETEEQVAFATTFGIENVDMFDGKGTPLGETENRKRNGFGWLWRWCCPSFF